MLVQSFVKNCNLNGMDLIEHACIIDPCLYCTAETVINNRNVLNQIHAIQNTFFTKDRTKSKGVIF